MRVGELAPAELTARLKTGNLLLRTGPFVNRVRSQVPAVGAALSTVYADHPLASDDSFVDFVVRVDLTPGLRRWLKPQIEFACDGVSPFNSLPADQGFPLFEWGLNWCVSAHMHRFVTLHSAVLERQGGALLLPAPSGSGKSTLCAGLAFAGWRLLSDELTLIDPDSGRVTPLPRPISLKNLSIGVIRSWAPQAVFAPVVHHTTKGDVAHCRPPADAVQRSGDPAMPRWIVLPRYEAGAATRLAPLPKARALIAMVESTFNTNVQRRRGFEALARTVDRCDCYEFTYSRLDEAVKLIDAMVDGAAAA